MLNGNQRGHSSPRTPQSHEPFQKQPASQPVIRSSSPMKETSPQIESSPQLHHRSPFRLPPPVQGGKSTRMLSLTSARRPRHPNVLSGRPDRTKRGSARTAEPTANLAKTNVVCQRALRTLLCGKAGKTAPDVQEMKPSSVQPPTFPPSPSSLRLPI